MRQGARMLAHGALALGAFAIGTAEFATMGFLPAFASDLGVDAPTGGQVVSAYALGVVVGAPLLAVLAARVERRRLLLMLLTWFAIGTTASALSPSFDSLVVLRFLTAIPHGGYFGVAALIAAGIVPPEERAAAVGRVMMGLALATVTGVPLAQILAQSLGWRYGFGATGMLALVAALVAWYAVPLQAPDIGGAVGRQLQALGNAQMWLTLAIGAIGFGGLFAVYTYVASTLVEVTRAAPSTVPVVLAIFGGGIVAGNALAPRLMLGGTLRAAGMLLAWSALALAVYPFTVARVPLISVAVFAVGIGGGLGTVLQVRLMEVAGEAQQFAAALNHAAFNVANALGPWLGGLAITSGFGLPSTGWVGCALAMTGFTICLGAARYLRRSG